MQRTGYRKPSLAAVIVFGVATLAMLAIAPVQSALKHFRDDFRSRTRN